MAFGRRGSSHWATQRRLVLLVRLLRGPAGIEELLEAVRQALGPEAYAGSPVRALEYDLHCLREGWGIELTYRRSERRYCLDALSLPLVDLPQEDLKTLAFLYHNFPLTAPHGNEVRAFLDRLMGLLPEERRRQVLRLRTIPELELDALDREEVSPDVWSAVEEAVVQRRQLAFSYRPARREAEEIPEHRHVVEPYEVELQDGHYYLEGYCLRACVGSEERSSVGTLRYRLSRIVPGTAKVLSARIPPGRRPACTYTLRYRLGPEIARGGVTPRFPETQVTLLPDGSAEVTARTSNLWRARQILLRYGEHCCILEPEELVVMMQETVARMARRYGLLAEGSGREEEAGTDLQREEPEGIGR